MPFIKNGSVKPRRASEAIAKADGTHKKLASSRLVRTLAVFMSQPIIAAWIYVQFYTDPCGSQFLQHFRGKIFGHIWNVPRTVS